jgi:hypothetical protein
LSIQFIQLRPERLAHLVVRLEVRPADQVHAIRHRGEDARHHLLAVLLQPFQRLLDGLRLPGQVDDQALAADHRHLPREDGRRHEAQADLAHLLAEARHLLVATASVASGVTSRGAGPVPPVVSTSEQPASTSSISVALMRSFSSGISRSSKSTGFFSARPSQSFSAGRPLSS